MNTTTSSEKIDISSRFDSDESLSPKHRPSSRIPLLHDLREHRWQTHSQDGRAQIKPSQFEQLASEAAGISSQRLRLLGTLLAAGTATSCAGRSLLRPIWATEAFERAHTMVRLVGALERHLPIHDNPSPWPEIETRLGIKLASVFDGLAISSDEEIRPCSVPIREIVRDLVELFGPALSYFTVDTSVDRLALPAYQHRALVLIASDLVTRALLHAFQASRFGRMTLRLSLLHRGTARLTVGHDSNFMPDRAQFDPSRCSVIDYLGDLLQTELVYRSRPNGGVVAEMEFPIPGSM